MTALLPVWAFVRRIPWWVFAIIAAATLGFFWHRGEVKQADQRGYDRAMGQVKARAERIKVAAEKANARLVALQNAINQDERTRYAVESRRIAGAGDDLRRLQPNQPALCPASNAAGSGRLSSGPVAPGRSGDVAVAPLPGRDWPVIVLPYQQTIDFAEAADLNRAEVLSCRSAWEKHRAAYEQWRREWVKAGEAR